jgi:hypothetical protein
VLVTMVGRMMTTGRFPLRWPSNISPIVLVNVYTFGHPKWQALQQLISAQLNQWPIFIHVILYTVRFENFIILHFLMCILPFHIPFILLSLALLAINKVRYGPF